MTDPLILVSAPAGDDKTTLLELALAARECGVACVTIDSADNDPLHFWTHVAASILGQCTALDEIAQELAAGEAERQAVLDRLLTDIETLVEPVVLVLDDLHEITSAEVLDALSRILSSPPENLQVIASTRIVSESSATRRRLLRQNDQMSEAIRIALEADDMAVDLLLDDNMPYAEPGWIAAVFDWLSAFGRDRVAQQPELSLQLARALLHLRGYDEVEPALTVPSLADPALERQFCAVGSQIQAIRSHLTRHLGDLVGPRAEAQAGIQFDTDPTSTHHRYRSRRAHVCSVGIYRTRPHRTCPE